MYESDFDEDDGSAVMVRIPVSCVYLDLHLQQTLSVRANKPWLPGSFEQSFPELDELTHGLDNVSLADVKKFLENQLNQSGKEVDVVGVRLPLEVITQWGLVLLVSIQMYYWLCQSPDSQALPSLPAYRRLHS
jgi:hypothetical protein